MARTKIRNTAEKSLRLRKRRKRMTIYIAFHCFLIAVASVDVATLVVDTEVQLSICSRYTSDGPIAIPEGDAACGEGDRPVLQPPETLRISRNFRRMEKWAYRVGSATSVWSNEKCTDSSYICCSDLRLIHLFWYPHFFFNLYSITRTLALTL